MAARRFACAEKAREPPLEAPPKTPKNAKAPSYHPRSPPYTTTTPGEIGFHDALASAKASPHTGLTSNVRPPIAPDNLPLARARWGEPSCLALSAFGFFFLDRSTPL
ncbi:hypothetical protein TARUN_4366 [Trichoderma arundinaceum]|uniref:Uncharacterized protein n=1 Tax=Trichoderma arundinaceum TaxID=490622 RepID=A0A395NP60_TRIAR|nr:hypothetical protein TARUN_4366 [Trichoderma arundinaceum]